MQFGYICAINFICYSMEKKILLALILITLLTGLFSHLDKIGLRAEEPRRAIVGIETYVTGNLIVPQIHNETYYNKPPVYNWIIALFYLIFQSFSEWVVRLPGILFFLLTGWTIYKATKSHLGEETALLGSLFYFTSADLLFYGTINAGEIDIFYAFVVVVQALAIFRYFHRKAYLAMFLVSYLLTFIGVMTKGIPSLAFQAITILAICLYYRKWKLLFSWQHIAGIIMLFTMLGGYFYLYNQQGNLEGFLAQQFAESSDKSFNEGSLGSIFKSIFHFPYQLLILVMPWSLLLIAFVFKKVRKGFSENKLLVFSILFVLTNIIIYWISPGVRNRYLYMFLPFLAIMAAWVYTKLPALKKPARLYYYFPIAGLVLSLIAVIIFPFFENVSQHVDNKWIYTSIFSVVIGLILFYAIPKPQLAIYLFILTIALGRIWFNLSVLPFLERRSTAIEYEHHVKNMNVITQNQQIFWTGEPLTYEPELKLAGHVLLKEAFNIPPTLPYGIPYYQFKHSGYIMDYDTVIQRGRYYLGPDTMIQQKNIDTLYAFKEKWHNRKLILFKKH